MPIAARSALPMVWTTTPAAGVAVWWGFRQPWSALAWGRRPQLDKQRPPLLFGRAFAHGPVARSPIAPTTHRRSHHRRDRPIYSYAGWPRRTGAIPCLRASTHVMRPFPLSSHRAKASTSEAGVGVGSAVITISTDAHPAITSSSASASRWSTVREYFRRTWTTLSTYHHLCGRCFSKRLKSKGRSRSGRRPALGGASGARG